MSFDFYFFILRLSNVLSVNTEPLLKLSSCPPLCVICSLLQRLQIVTYINLGVSQLKLDSKINGWCQFLNSKSSTSIIHSLQKQPFPHVFVLKVQLFVEKLIFCLTFSRLRGFYIFPFFSGNTFCFSAFHS